MKRSIKGIAFFAALGLIGLVPLVSVTGGNAIPLLSPNLVAAFNMLGWSLVIVLLVARRDMRAQLEIDAERLGLDVRRKGAEKLLEQIIAEVNRKNSSLSINLVERRITSKEELSVTLERIVALSFKLLSAESAELALFDRDSGLYHSAFVLGKPFSVGAQAMLSDAIKGETPNSPEVMVQPIVFSGTILGTLRVGLKKGRIPSIGDIEIIKLLALQSSLAVINAQYTSELFKMKRASEESVKAKTGFLANLSHELRGPLGIMLNAVELVLDGLCGPVNSEQLDTLKMVHSNGEHLLELINDVLDYAKVESGKLTPNKTEVLCDDLLRDITEVVRTQAELKSHRLVFLPCNETLVVSCDRRHIRQMMINLLTNAIKYTPDGGHIEVWAERAPGYKIKLNVKDSGVGIEASERDKVFAAFERVKHSYSLNQVGTGLGMPLTKKLAEVNGGGIDFSSVPNEGSHFWLLFPAVELTSSIINESDNEQSQRQGEAKGHGETVLLVEKEEGDRNMLAHYLTHTGFKVLQGKSKEEALEILRSTHIDVGIVDNNIADNPEEDIITVIRENAHNANFPLILLSSRAFVFDIEKYLKLGVDRCLTKPIQLKALGKICRELIDACPSAALDTKAPKEKGDSSHEKGEKILHTDIAADDVLH
jgi:signal transduction histidine kinase/CheY-like chemotaxis protein